MSKLVSRFVGLVFVLLIMLQALQTRADVVAAINKSFVNMSSDPLVFEASGTFEFTAATSDIVGTIGFRKIVTLPPMLTDMPVQHALFGEWDESWSLTKIGFSNPQPGVLAGFDPSEIGFSAMGTFDVDIEMLGPVPPGHSSRTKFSAEVPIELLPVEDVITLLESLATSNPDIAPVIDLIDTTPGTVMPVARTSLHIPEPTSLAMSVILAGASVLVWRGR